MKKMGNNIIIGVDHGYGYIKSASTIFKSGVEELPIKPPFMEDILELKNRTFVVGQIRNEHPADKTKTDEYYNLTLVSLAKEMKSNGITEAKNVILASGLPYSFFSAQKDQFKEYLLKKKILNFTYEGQKYHVELKDVHIYPQGLPVLAKELDKYKEKTISVVDIGSRTIDVITYRKGKPFYNECFSQDKKGTLDCIDLVSKNFLAKFQEKIDEEDIQCIMQKESCSLNPNQVTFVKEIIKFYAKDVLKLIDSKLNGSIIICGGGASVIKNYAGKLRSGIEINDDIFCNARGFEILSANRLK